MMILLTSMTSFRRPNNGDNLHRLAPPIIIHIRINFVAGVKNANLFMYANNAKDSHFVRLAFTSSMHIINF